MNPTKHRKLLYLSILWSFALSILTALALPKQFLNADVLMQSIMSLQNTTLYYWGQNRFINVLPLAISWISDPRANLTASLLLSAMCFYLLLLALSRLAVAVAKVPDPEPLALKTFILASAAFAWAFTPRGVFELTIGHIEYSLPALLLVLALQFSVLRTGASWSSLLATFLAVFLAIGLNPTTVLPGLFIAAATALYRKRVGMPEAALALSCLLAYLAWNFIASYYGDSNYTSFDPAILQVGIVSAITALINDMRLATVALVLAVLALARLLAFVSGRAPAKAGDPGLEGYLRNGAIIFAIAWLLLFASNQWVEANRFSWRYFSYILFVALFCLALSFAKVLALMNSKASGATAIGAALLSVLALYSEPAAVEDYQLFRDMRAFAQPGKHLYAGDYWLVWPSVFRDMLQGHEAYGLALRGESNREAARKYVLRQIARTDQVSVLCLNAKAEECVHQANANVGPVRHSEAVAVGGMVSTFRLSAVSGELDYQGQAFRGLPSEVGVVGEGVRTSDGRPGFLAFGPYVPVDSGEYQLQVFGSAQSAGAAFVDVVSGGGKKAYAKFNLQPGTGDVLLREALLSIPDNAPDIEVRIWVSAASRLKLTGYRLQRR